MAWKTSLIAIDFAFDWPPNKMILLYLIYLRQNAKCCTASSICYFFLALDTVQRAEEGLTFSVSSWEKMCPSSTYENQNPYWNNFLVWRGSSKIYVFVGKKRIIGGFTQNFNWKAVNRIANAWKSDRMMVVMEQSSNWAQIGNGSLVWKYWL